MYINNALNSKQLWEVNHQYGFTWGRIIHDNLISNTCEKWRGSIYLAFSGQQLRLRPVWVSWSGRAHQTFEPQNFIVHQGNVATCENLLSRVFLTRVGVGFSRKYAKICQEKIRAPKSPYTIDIVNWECWKPHLGLLTIYNKSMFDGNEHAKVVDLSPCHWVASIKIVVAKGMNKQ